jgi:hypothetical protein
MNHDDDLRERFAALRREDARSAPSFDRLLRTAARPAPRPTARFAPAAGVVLAVAAVFFWGVRWHDRTARHAEPVIPLADWHSPTDFLLETPGSPLLREVPRIGDPTLNETVPARRPGQERAT